MTAAAHPFLTGRTSGLAKGDWPSSRRVTELWRSHSSPRNIARRSTREASRTRAIRRFRWSILGPLIALFALVLVPVLFLQLYFSFHQWTVYLGSWWEAEFVGLELFREVLTDERFGWAIVRSLAFAIASTVGCFVLGFLLAYLMYEPFRGQSFFYIMFILPMLTVPIVVAYTAEMLLYQSGPINDIISRLTGTSSRRPGSPTPKIALAAVTLLEIWNWTPFSFIIMLAGLSSIPKEPMEAAADSRRVALANVLGGAASAAAAGDLSRAGAALPRSDGGIPENLGAVPGRARHRDRDDPGLHLPDHLAVLPGLQGRGALLRRDDADDRDRAARDPAVAAREARDRRDVRATPEAAR